MGLQRIAAEDLLHGLSAFDAIVDTRSESEFAEDHLPGALNWPVLNDAERAWVGTGYKQVSAFDARKRGAALAAANIARHVQQHVLPLPKGWRPLVYCWRGGQRSGSLALVLSEIGFGVTVLDGGYRAFRRAVLSDLQTRPQRLVFQVLAGRTGSAKSRLLQALATEGAQVLDLEALAGHRGSVLGLAPGQRQPSQKAFETALWQTLAALDPTRPVFAEGESRTIGRLRIPEALLQALRAAQVWRIELATDGRVAFLLDDYAHFVADVDAFCARLAALRELRGAATIERWQSLARANDFVTPVRELLEQHYDPVYLKSMRKHYAGFDQATVIELVDAQPATLTAAAQSLLASERLR
jgi:tRNA 2-selenouridine synthase